AAPAGALERVRGVVHVHSDLTTGDFTLEGLVGLAERQGIGALLLAENYALRVDYGLPPFRALTRVSRHERSLGAAPEAYLARVAEVQRQLPHVLLIPGVEVMPHYYWTGSPLALDLTVHNLQKNLLVFGITDPAALRTLPMPGNRAAGVYTLQSALDALPGLLLIPGVVLLRRRRAVRKPLGRGAVVVVRRRSWATGTLLCLVGLVALVRGWPFTVERHPPSQDFGVAPYQALIDRVDALGGATVWSFPEARDAGEERYGPLRVAWLTEPYADDLLRTFRYTAFGAVYEDTSTFERPGGGWDRLLGEYARGERSRPAWALAESGFHGLVAGKQVGPLQTVFLVAEKSPAAVLDALRRGRMYAVQRTRELGLDLAEFAVRAGGLTAGAGETLRAPPGTPIEVAVAVEASDGRPHDVRLAIVLDGRVVALDRGGAPLRTLYRTTAGVAPLVVRVEARGSQQRVVSNPVFVKP
ncbi:MAG TPA: hypothetical protein VFV05_05740, partial [Methylomirabilota bacterium]|nr:hypothetical protein [Methylomirabilota bacterium]